MSELLLVFRAGTHMCALGLRYVTEIMRPLPVEPLTAESHFVTGICVVRGEPAPVVNAAALVGDGEHEVTRFITVAAEKRTEAGERQCPVVLAVDSVLGVREIPSASLHELPPLLGAVSSDLVDSLGVVGTEPLLLLRSARLLTESARAEMVQPDGTRVAAEPGGTARS